MQSSQSSQWQLQPTAQLPGWFIQAVQQYLPESDGHHAAQLLWQRGVHQLDQLAGFIDPNHYQPTSPFAFGEEMTRAVARLQQAFESAEKVAIWGDFDADGITATAVLWEGLGEFFPPQQLTYVIPNRLTESHGLSLVGIADLAAQGYRLIVTCDTGSTSAMELAYARQLDIDVIVTDHHTLPAERPLVTAILNPRTLPTEHPLANLSGVAVAYKLVEALYETLPHVPQRPLTDLLDLVAIGLISDLVDLTGDCRYLAQVGIACLQRNQDPINPPRPGIAKLLELCRRSGDRPTDISFGLGPRINAISRIQGDARFCVELLTSRDPQRCQQLALETELANARRKALQREVLQQAKAKIAQLDLSTTRVIVLADPQWSVGILGLVATQIAQEYGRPTILLSTEGSELNESAQLEITEAEQETAEQETKYEPGIAIERTSQSQGLARGSARSVNQIDLYDLLQSQAHLLHRFGGHPFAAGLSLSLENLALFTQAINQQMRLLAKEPVEQAPTADLVVTVAELGKFLFQELKLLEPYGMGNPVPKLLIQNCWFTKTWHKKLQDLTGKKLEYIKTEFEICDDSCTEGFPGVWWGHYKDELPVGRCDVLAELDFNSYEDAKRKKRYEIRLLAVKASAVDSVIPAAEPIDWIFDQRGNQRDENKITPETNPEINPATNSETNLSAATLVVQNCPSSWDEVYAWSRQAKQTKRKLVLAYSAPNLETPNVIWQQLVGIAKHLSRTGQSTTRQQLQNKLKIGSRSLQLGLNLLEQFGFSITTRRQKLQISYQPPQSSHAGSVAHNAEFMAALEQFAKTIQEEQFMQQYFYQVPLATLQATVAQAI